MMEKRFERFAAAVLEMNRYLQRIKEQEMRRFGLRSAHTMCIFYLGQHPEGLTVTQLTEICREDKAAVSRNLSELSRMGLVSCSAPPDRRGVDGTGNGNCGAGGGAGFGCPQCLRQGTDRSPAG